MNFGTCPPKKPADTAILIVSNLHGYASELSTQKNCMVYHLPTNKCHKWAYDSIWRQIHMRSLQHSIYVFTPSNPPFINFGIPPMENSVPSSNHSRGNGNTPATWRFQWEISMEAWNHCHVKHDRRAKSMNTKILGDMPNIIPCRLPVTVPFFGVRKNHHYTNTAESLGSQPCPRLPGAGRSIISRPL